MAARTCLLCGKALGRFAAAGEDFCSREHRNQYHLRQGMERLAEANQVANVMRRREHPRHIPVEQLRAAGQTGRRGYLDPLPAPAPEARLPRIATATAGLKPASTFLRPIAHRDAAPQLVPGTPLAISMRRRGPSVTASLYAHVAPAPVVRPGPASVQVESPRRLAVAPKPKVSRVETRRASFPPPVVCGAPPRKLDASVMGRALRVSPSAAFRLSEAKLRAVASAPQTVSGMRWPGLLPLDALRPYRSEATACRIDPSEPEMRLPQAPSEAFAGTFEWPGAMTVSISFVDAAPGPRSTFVPFSSEERR